MSYWKVNSRVVSYRVVGVVSCHVVSYVSCIITRVMSYVSCNTRCVVRIVSCHTCRVLSYVSCHMCLVVSVVSYVSNFFISTRALMKFLILFYMCRIELVLSYMSCHTCRVVPFRILSYRTYRTYIDLSGLVLIINLVDKLLIKFNIYLV